MILLTTSLKCTNCGAPIGASLITNPEKRPTELDEQLAVLRRLALEHRCPPFTSPTRVP
jgi:hypothetical protein